MKKDFKELSQKELKEIEGGLPFLFYAGIALAGFIWAILD